MGVLKFLCLHGAGTRADILETQLGAITRELSRDNSATFHFIEGQFESDPGPGIASVFDGPYFTYYKWPLHLEDNESYLEEAHRMIYETIEEEGPFDGLLGFSHGGTLASSFLIQHAKNNPYDLPLFQCAVFISSLPPFRINDDNHIVYEDDSEGWIRIPTLHVLGTEDFAYKDSLHLVSLCNKELTSVVNHSQGHEIPRDASTVIKIASHVRKLSRYCSA